MALSNRLISTLLGVFIGIYVLNQVWILSLGSVPVWLIAGLALLNTLPVVLGFCFLLYRLRRVDDFARLVI